MIHKMIVPPIAKIGNTLPKHAYKQSQRDAGPTRKSLLSRDNSLLEDVIFNHSFRAPKGYKTIAHFLKA